MERTIVDAGRVPRDFIRGLVADAEEMAVSGFARPSDIDTGMRLGAGHPLGPLELVSADAGQGNGSSRLAADQDKDVVAAAAAAPWTSRVAVVGTGTMATGIVEVLARRVPHVVVLARSAESYEGLRVRLGASLARSVRKGRLTEAAMANILTRITGTYDHDAASLQTSELVIEAVTEQLSVKQQVLSDLDSCLPARVVIATNTSSFRVSELSSALPPERSVLALHFFNPAPAMSLMEVVVRDGASPHLAEAGMAWARHLGKVPVRCGDARGFIVNRLLIPFLNDVARTVTGDSDVAEIDRGVVEELGHPMGPLALIDLIGVDVTVAALDSMYEQSPDPRLQAAPRLHSLINSGRLGRKSGAGFFQYGAPAPKEAT